MLDESVASSKVAARRGTGRRQPAGAAHQRGLSLVSLIFVGLIVVALLAVGMKTVPALTEYFAIERAVQRISSEGQTVRDIRSAFDRYATIDDIKSIAGKDLDVTKDADHIVVSYSYQYSIPITDNVRIVIDFAGSNRDHAGRSAQP